MLCGQFSTRLLGHGPEDLIPGLSIQHTLHYAFRNTEKSGNATISQPDGV